MRAPLWVRTGGYGSVWHRALSEGGVALCGSGMRVMHDPQVRMSRLEYRSQVPDTTNGAQYMCLKCWRVVEGMDPPAPLREHQGPMWEAMLELRNKIARLELEIVMLKKKQGRIRGRTTRRVSR